jgi:hypothetical protein
VNEKNVQYYWLSRWGLFSLQGLVTSILIGGMIVTTQGVDILSDSPSILLPKVFAIVFFVLVMILLLVRDIHCSQSEDDDKCVWLIFPRWRRLTKLSLSQIPLTEEERVAVKESLVKILRKSALEVNSAIISRDAIRKASETDKIVGGLELRELRRIRKERESLKLELQQATDLAEKRHGEYLQLWDLFTKGFPDGMGVVPSLAGVNPDEWRKEQATSVTN